MGKPKYDWQPIDARLASLSVRPPEGTLKALAAEYEVPYSALITHIWVLRKKGRTNVCAHRRWTAAEEAWLDENYARYSLQRLCRHLQRSRVAIVQRAYKLGLTRTRDGYTLADIARALGYDHSIVADWRAQGWIAAHNRGTRVAPLYWIPDQAIHTFLILYANRWHWARVQDVSWVQAMLTDADLLKKESTDVQAARLAGGDRFRRPPRQHNTVTGTHRMR